MKTWWSGGRAKTKIVCGLQRKVAHKKVKIKSFIFEEKVCCKRSQKKSDGKKRKRKLMPKKYTQILAKDRISHKSWHINKPSKSRLLLRKNRVLIFFMLNQPVFLRETNNWTKVLLLMQILHVEWLWHGMLCNLWGLFFWVSLGFFQE